MEGNPPLPVPFGPGNLRPPQPPRDHDLHPLRPQPHGGLDRPFHGSTEGHPPLQLGRRGLRYQLRVGLRLPDFGDVELKLLIGHGRKLLANLVDLGTFSADDDAGARGSNDDAELICFALKLDAGDAGVVQSLLEVPTDLEVFVELICIRPGREPPRFPGLDVPQSKSLGMDFLSHVSPPIYEAGRSSSTMVI